MIEMLGPLMKIFEHTRPNIYERKINDMKWEHNPPLFHQKSGIPWWSEWSLK